MNEHQITPIRPPRGLTPEERRLLGYLLSVPFAGSHELLGQIPHLRVSAACSACPTIELVTEDDVPRALVSRRIPVEARGRDVDGVPIQVLLHVLNGTASEIEVCRVDGQEIRTMPETASLELFVGAG
jgi:hypothetical protein